MALRGRGLDGADVAAEFGALGLEYAMLDEEGLSCKAECSPEDGVYSAYLAENCQVAGRVDTPGHYGPVANIVYRCAEPAMP